MDVVFFRAGETGINSTFSLASKGCQDFKIMLTPINLDGFEASITVEARSEILGQTVTDKSPELRVDVAGPDLPPQGMDLGLIELDNRNSIIMFASGWALALILLMYIRLFRKPADILERRGRKKKPHLVQMKLELMNTTRSHVLRVERDSEFLRVVSRLSDSHAQNVKLESGLLSDYLFAQQRKCCMSKWAIHRPHSSLRG